MGEEVDVLQGKETSVADDVKLFSEDETSKEPEVKQPEPDKAPVKIEEESEKKEEPDKKEEPTEEPEVEGMRSHLVKKIAKDDPDFLKKYPEVRDLAYREHEYTKVFPTVEDAQEASEKVQDYDELEGLVSTGSPESLGDFLKIIKENDGAVFSKFAENLLPALYKQDSQAYIRVTTPLFENLVRAAYREGDENLQNAALVISKYLFGDYDIAKGSKTTIVKAAEPVKDESFEKEKKEFYGAKLRDFEGVVFSKSEDQLKDIIKDNIDPDNHFNAFALRNLVKEVYEEVDRQIDADQQFKSRINSMWKQAYKAGLPKDWTDKIVSAYLSRAKVLVPAIRSKLRAEALADRSAKSQENAQKSEEAVARGKDVSGTGATPKGNNSNPTAKQVDWSKTSDEDLFSDKITLKR